MAIRELPVDATAFQDLRAVTVEPRLDSDGEQRRDRDGRPLFNVQLAVMVESFGKSSLESIVLTVPASTDGKAPLEGLQPYTPVRVQGMRVKPWEFNGRSGLAFSAEAIQPAQPQRREA